jgi:hypothetical protein
MPKKNLTLDMSKYNSKYDFEYVCQKEKLTSNMSKYNSKYDIEYVWQKKN